MGVPSVQAPECWHLWRRETCWASHTPESRLLPERRRSQRRSPLYKWPPAPVNEHGRQSDLKFTQKRIQTTNSTENTESFFNAVTHQAGGPESETSCCRCEFSPAELDQSDEEPAKTFLCITQHLQQLLSIISTLETR